MQDSRAPITPMLCRTWVSEVRAKRSTREMKDEPNEMRATKDENGERISKDHGVVTSDGLKTNLALFKHENADDRPFVPGKKPSGHAAHKMQYIAISSVYTYRHSAPSSRRLPALRVITDSFLPSHVRIPTMRLFRMYPS